MGTHRFTDNIDGDGHGSGPLHIRFALTRTPDDRFIFDASETDDQAAGPVNFLMNWRRARDRRWSIRGGRMNGYSGRCRTATNCAPATCCGSRPAAAVELVTLVRTMPVHFEGGTIQTSVYERAALPAGAAFAGPAILMQLDATTLIPPG